MDYRLENITVILSVKDIAVSRTFYTDTLGFKEASWGNNEFTAFQKDGKGMYLCKGGQGQPGTWVWMGFDGDIFKLYNELKSRGVVIKLPPTNFSWALEMQIEDPDGHVLRFGTSPDEKKPFEDIFELNKIRKM